MVRTAAFSILAVAALAAAAPAAAQVHDGSDQSPAEQRTADALRAAGSACDAPACRTSADGIYPPSTRSGEGARSPSISAGHTQD